MLKKHVVARLQRVAKIHIFFCMQKNGNGFFTTTFLVCYLTDCFIIVYVGCVLVVVQPVFANWRASVRLFGE